MLRLVAWLVLPASALVPVSPLRLTDWPEGLSSCSVLSWAAGLRVCSAGPGPAGCGGGTACLAAEVRVWGLKPLRSVCGWDWCVWCWRREARPLARGRGGLGQVRPREAPCVPPAPAQALQVECRTPPGRSSHGRPSFRFRAWASVSLVKEILKISSFR